MQCFTKKQSVSLYLFLQIPAHDQEIGHCTKCGKTWNIMNSPETTSTEMSNMTLSNFSRHINLRCTGTNAQIKDPGFKCNSCGKKFSQKEKLQKHPCTQMGNEPDDTYVTYTLISNKFPLAKMIKECNDLTLKHEVLYSEKIAIKGKIRSSTISFS